MPYCEYCGSQVGETAAACASCGHPLGAPAAPPVAAAAGTEPTAIAALICGIIGVVSCPYVLSVAALVLGLVARSKIRATPGLGGGGMATAGVVLGIVGLVVGVLTTVLWRGLHVGPGW